MNTHFLRVCAIGALAGMPAAAIWAADNCSGTYSQVVVSSKTAMVAEGVTITSFVNQGTTLSADSPYNGVGSCAGYMLRSPGGAPLVAGVCSRLTEQGDTWSYTWSYDPSGDSGTWEAAGGTGAFANVKASGWFKRTMQEGKVTTGTWGGTCE